jgi:serine/threonine-protein kinase
MDATRLPPPAATTAPDGLGGSTVPDMPVVRDPSDASAARTVMGGGPTSIAGRYLMSPETRTTPTGIEAEAHDTQAGGAVVRLKVVPTSVLPQPAMADRALRELKQLAKVSSERVLKVLDQGRLDDGRIYVVTEQFAGRTLEELLADGPLPVDRAAAIVVQVGEALTEAQKVGVIHRDVSPRSVLVGAGDKVKVTDFGLAEPVNDKVFGAPAYLSPEQVEGKPVDQRSNIYSLAAILYHATVGKPPFVGDPASLCNQHLTATPPVPSQERPGLPVEIDRIIQKALEKSGGRRHLTLRQLLSEIEALAKAGAPVATSGPTSAQTRAPAATVMGIASPFVGAGKAPGGGVAPQPAPGAVPSTPQARTVMAEAPKLPASVPAAPTGAAPSTPEARTVMAEAPKVAVAAPAPTTPVAASPAPVAARPVQSAPDVRTVMAEAPAVAVAAPAPTPSPLPAPTPTPAPTPAPAPAGSASTLPPKVQQAVAQAQAQRTAAAATGQPGKGGFRETAWFKAGELQEELDKRAAEEAAKSGGDPLAAAGTTGEHRAVGGEVDPSKIDVTAADRARLSLKTGATQAMPAIKAPSGAVPVPGERMDEKEMLAEIDSSKKWFIVAGIVIGLAIIGIVLWLTLGRSSPAQGTAEGPPQPPQAVAGAPPPGSPAPPPAAPTAPPPTPATPSAATAAAPKGAGGAEALAEARSAIGAGDLAAAVAAYGRAAGEGAPAAELKKVRANLEKAISKKAAAAKKRKDRAGEAEAKRLLAQVKSAPSRRR